MKLLTSDHPEVFRVVWETGITAVILPEFDACMETPQHNPHHLPGLWAITSSHTLAGVEKDKVPPVAAALLHDIGSRFTRTTDEQGIDHFHGHAKVGAEMANGILRRLKFDNDTRKQDRKAGGGPRRPGRSREPQGRAPGHSPDRHRSVSRIT